MTLSAALKERLATVRKVVTYNHSPISELTDTPTPLATYIKIYNKSRGIGRMEHMKGADLLATYLAPIVVPSVLDIVLPKYIPATFDINEIRILAQNVIGTLDKHTGHPREYTALLDRTMKIIVYLTAKEILGDV